jgi:hypothetical protein
MVGEGGEVAYSSGLEEGSRRDIYFLTMATFQERSAGADFRVILLSWQWGKAGIREKE